MNVIDYRIIPVEELILDEGETARRLHTSKGYRTTEIDECLAELEKAVNCKYASVRCPINFCGSNVIDLGFCKFKSENLTKNLQGCKEVFVFGVTLGHGVDRLLSRLSLVSPAKHFITDALASSMAEAAANKAEELIKGGLDCKARFSPGYGDLPLEIQIKILENINAQRLLGITINDALLMSPGKSVTAIMGIKNE